MPDERGWADWSCQAKRGKLGAIYVQLSSLAKNHGVDHARHVLFEIEPDPEEVKLHLHLHLRWGRAVQPLEPWSSQSITHPPYANAVFFTFSLTS
jgi:hypothetical protein